MDLLKLVGVLKDLPIECLALLVGLGALALAAFAIHAMLRVVKGSSK